VHIEKLPVGLTITSEWFLVVALIADLKDDNIKPFV